MKITLLRHGAPDVNLSKRIIGTEIKQAIQHYNTAGIAKDSNPPDSARQVAHSANVIVCSHLVRSLQSAQKLTQKEIDISDAIFQEAGLPHPNHFSLKLPAKTWTVLLRMLWLLGYTKNAESISNTRQRAKQAAEQLIKIAQQHQHVLLVGHGVFNHLIASELKKSGWLASKKSPRNYWEYTTYKI